MIQITWLGHANFEIKFESGEVLLRALASVTCPMIFAF